MGGRLKFNGPGRRKTRAFRRCRRDLDDAAALLIQFDGFKQRLKITFAETLVALALDDFEEDWTDGVLGEYLQQDAAVEAAVDQNAAPL